MTRQGEIKTQPRIAIQGYEGSFHEVAAHLFFGKACSVVPCASFRNLIRQASDGHEAEAGIMAIENSIAGSILPNYQLLQKSDLVIVGEVYLPIKQQLLANPGVSLADIREVHSHPMAILQCTEFLDQHHWRLVETEDTALSAKHVAQHRSKHIAAIASKLAAEKFGLSVLAPNIHTQKKNYTRFLALQRAKTVLPNPAANKASVNFKTDHETGSLAKVLSAIAAAGINLSKLQSFPIPGGNWQYSFYADLEFDQISTFENILPTMRQLTREWLVMGTYQKGQQTA
jgi:prephenate dehydratase